MRILTIIILFTALLYSNLSIAGDGFRRPFQLGDYYEYDITFVFPGGSDTYRYSAKVIGDTLVNGLFVSTVRIYDEPPFGNHTVVYKFDSVSLKIYDPDGACPDLNGNYLAGGFNFSEGYIWNTCSDTTGAVYFRSIITDTGTYSGFLQSGIPLKYFTRRDTSGNPIDIASDNFYCEMFGFFGLASSGGNPFGGGPFSKVIRGAIIDSVTYGTILLNVHQISLEIPYGYSLSKNYPNPFNPSTNIKFDIPVKENVRLVVYDQLGREVRELVNETLSTGSYEYLFTANNLSSGLYYYTLQTGNYTQTKKMLLVK